VGQVGYLGDPAAHHPGRVHHEVLGIEAAAPHVAPHLRTAGELRCLGHVRRRTSACSEYSSSRDIPGQPVRIAGAAIAAWNCEISRWHRGAMHDCEPTTHGLTSPLGGADWFDRDRARGSCRALAISASCQAWQCGTANANWCPGISSSWNIPNTHCPPTNVAEASYSLPFANVERRGGAALDSEDFVVHPSR